MRGKYKKNRQERRPDREFVVENGDGMKKERGADDGELLLRKQREWPDLLLKTASRREGRQACRDGYRGGQDE